MDKFIDLRSDTVTKPTPEMLEAMANAEVGDDVYGDDPTVIKLEKTAADMFGKESALFFSSGTQANISALLVHCGRGEEYICGQIAHNYKYEAGGAAVLGSIQPQPIEVNSDGTMDLEKIEAAVKPDDIHFARTRLISLENTIHGRPLSMSYMKEVAGLARRHKLKMHLDGARIFNASVALGVSAGDIAEIFDTVSICLSKNLCAPVGSLLVGSSENISAAKRWRKMLGGGMRQAGYLAAAGLVALLKMPARLHEDHENARLFAASLSDKFTGRIQQHTCMVFIELSEDEIAKLKKAFDSKGIKATLGGRGYTERKGVNYSLNRFVFHNDIRSKDREKVAMTMLEALSA